MRKGTLAMNTFLAIVVTFLVIGVLLLIIGTNFVPGLREAVYNMRFGL
jgi:hypothetical protein